MENKLEPTTPATSSPSLQAFSNEADSSQETRQQGRAILMGMAITVLIFVNVGIFYTTRLTQQTSSATNKVEEGKIIKTTLDAANLEKLQNRTSVDVESKLTPYTSGKDNPFN